MSGNLNVAAAKVRPSKSNVRRAVDTSSPAFRELVESVKRHGVLQPVLCRENGDGYELICGHRRLEAAREAGHETIPARIIAATDDYVLEVQLVENLQRADIHPLDEAEGYRRLLAGGKGKAKRDAAGVAAMVGRSVGYIYDRLRLLDLVDELRELFRAGEILPGHAVILARLTPQDQRRALGLSKGTLAEKAGGLFEREQILWDPEAKGGGRDARKAVSVRELQAWVDSNVRFRATEADPMLFPDTSKAVTVAAASPDKRQRTVIPITYDHHVVEHAREGRTWGPQSWKRADGKAGTKKCEHAVLGVVAIGPHRGEAFDVCTNKERCATHWAAWKRERAKRRVSSAAAGGSADERWKREEQRRKAEQVKAAALRERWKKARPAVLDALAAAVTSMPIRPRGPFDAVLLSEVRMMRDHYAAKHAGIIRGSSAEDLVRHLAFLVLCNRASEWRCVEELPQFAKAFGVDVRKIMDEVAPAEKPKAEASAASKARTKRKARKK